MITLTVNGKKVEVQPDITLQELLINQDVESPQSVSVELNNEMVLRQEYETTHLKENDRVEFLYFMGGGAV